MAAEFYPQIDMIRDINAVINCFVEKGILFGVF